jgi:glycosyltransferase involved in cell wall biosynthesis
MSKFLEKNRINRVAVLSLFPISTTGGGESYTINCAKSVSLDNIECDLISPVDQGFTSDRSPNRFNQLFFHQTLLNRKCTTSYNLLLSQVLENIPTYDCVWIHQYLASPSVYDILANTHIDQQIIFTNLGYEENYYDFWARYSMMQNHLFLEISEFAAKRVKKHTDNVDYIYSGIWENAIDSYEYQAKRKGSFVSVGRVLPHKGFEIAIDALPSNSELTIIGPFQEDHYLNYLKMKSKSKQVNFIGRIIDSEKNSIIANSISLIANSVTITYQSQKFEHSELLGLVILEAIANHTLPIASDQSALREIMRALGLENLVYKQRDIKDLRAKINLVSQFNEEQYDKMVQQSLHILRENFLWDSYCKRLRDKL